MTFVYVCVALGWIGCLVLADAWMICVFATIYGCFLFVRFRNLFWLLVWTFLVIGSLILTSSKEEVPQMGEYEVVEIKTNYCIASNHKQRILLYGLEEPSYYDVYDVRSVEKITNLKNISLFSFEDYMARRQIYYGANHSTFIRSQRSLRASLYHRLKQNPFLLKHIYGIYEEESKDAMIQLGVPILGVLYGLKKWMRRKWSEFTCDMVLICIGILYGYCFMFTIPILRFLCVHISKCMHSDKKQAYATSLLLYGVLAPHLVCEFGFLFPMSVRLLQLFTQRNMKQTLYIRALLLVYLWFFFHTVNIWTFLFFGFLRKGLTLLFVLNIFQCTWFNDVWNQWLYRLPNLSWNYVPSVLFYICIGLFLLTKKRFWVLSLCVSILCTTHIDPFFHVYMFDIGQGDCTLIVEPFQKSVVMIDCGQSLYRDNMTTIVLPFLKNHHIHQIDTLIITHDDYDHNGGLNVLKENIHIQHIVTSSEEKIDVAYPFELLLPNRNAKDENDKSLVTYFAYDNGQYIWTGDAGVDVEKEILKNYSLHPDVLKLGHHGSNTSSSYEFLDTLQPKLGLVSVGAKNRYRHPSDEVISRCHELGIHVLETKDVGMIHLFSFRNVIMIETANGLLSVLRIN